MPTQPSQPAAYTDRYVEAGGLKLHYLDYGTAGRPPMVCLHGGAAHAHWYDFIAPQFTSDHHMIALEGRGHGDSAWAMPPDYTYERYAADLDEVAKALDLSNFTLVGHSVGGVVALLYCAKYAGRVGRLIIIDSVLTTSPDRVARFREMAAKPAPTFATRDELIAKYKLNPPETSATPEVVHYLASHDVRQNDDGRWQTKFDRNFYAQREWRHSFDCWSEIKIPVLLMKAAQSDRVTPQIIAEVQKRCPQVRTVTAADSNHHVMLDNPAAFAGEIRKFVDATE